MPFGVGFFELMVVMVVAVLLFGSRLPEVARNFGASYQQFRKGLYEIQNSIKVDLDAEADHNRRITYRDYQDDYDAPPAAKFTPPLAEDSEPEPVLTSKSGDKQV